MNIVWPSFYIACTREAARAALPNKNDHVLFPGADSMKSAERTAQRFSGLYKKGG